MDKFTPYGKLSKKKKKALNALRRKTWGALSPVTRKPENSRAYNRAKARKWDHEDSGSVPFACRGTFSSLICASALEKPH